MSKLVKRLREGWANDGDAIFTEAADCIEKMQAALKAVMNTEGLPGRSEWRELRRTIEAAVPPDE